MHLDLGSLGLSSMHGCSGRVTGVTAPASFFAPEAFQLQLRPRAM
jgi:hypothetical protein